jgi:hypothetical protein
MNIEHAARQFKPFSREEALQNPMYDQFLSRATFMRPDFPHDDDIHLPDSILSAVGIPFRPLWNNPAFCLVKEETPSGNDLEMRASPDEDGFVEADSAGVDVDVFNYLGEPDPDIEMGPDQGDAPLPMESPDGAPQKDAEAVRVSSGRNAGVEDATRPMDPTAGAEPTESQIVARPEDSVAGNATQTPWWLSLSEPEDVAPGQTEKITLMKDNKVMYEYLDDGLRSPLPFPGENVTLSAAKQGMNTPPSRSHDY